jgi:NAD(P)-dependent dehydrogenase (short-subunit alcohol dehydrogenase family)
MSTYDFDGQVAIITGGASGMGRATAEAFAASGARVVVADIAVDAGQEVVAGIEAAGGTATFVPTDVAETDAVRALVGGTVAAYGRLDHAVNGAAIETENARLADCTEADFDRLMRVNLRSVFLCMKYEIRQMLAQGDGGTIVNIASIDGFRSRATAAAYGASKHAVIGLTKAVAIEYAGDGIRINAIAPGAIDTPMLTAAIEKRGGHYDAVIRRMSPVGRFGRASEIAEAALWLCSDRSSFTVGHVLAVDAGYLAT